MEKPFRNWLAVLTSITLVSLVAFRMTTVESIVWVLLVGAVFVLALRRVEYGLLALVAEMLTSGNGRLFELHAAGALVSLRMGIFAVVMVAWAIDVVRQRRVGVLVQQRSIQAVFAFLLVLIWGFVHGLFVRHLSVGGVVSDGNGWLYFAALLPVLDLGTRQNREQWFSRVLSLVRAGVVFLCAKAWMIFLLTAGAGSVVATYLYHFVRQTSGGQIAPASHGMWRIYEWPELLLIPAMLYLVNQYIEHTRERTITRRETAILFMVIATLVLTLFRSYWLGAIVGLGCLVLAQVRAKWRAVVQTKLVVIGLVVVSVFAIMGIGSTLSWMRAGMPSIQKELFTAGEPGVQNRIAQAGPLFAQIRKAPIFGSGFGTTVTYESTDLREQGQFTTAALELGWLDMLMEVGVVGVGVFLVLFSVVYMGSPLWIVCSVLALGTVHLVSPFLNHPVGVVVLALLAVIMQYQKSEKAGLLE